MSLTTKIKDLDHKFAWSSFGVILSILFFIFSIYTTFVYEKSPEFEIQIIDKGPVFNIRESVANLDVIYNDSSIQDKDEMLSTIYARIINTGNSDLLKSHFDTKYLPTISLSSGKLITASITGGSSNYLISQSEISTSGNSSATISPIILEPGQYFTFKLLVLHPNSAQPTLGVAGKVAGIRELKVTSVVTAEKTSFLNRCFSGDIIIQSTRFLVYCFGGLILILVILNGISNFSNWLTTRQRKSFSKKFTQDIGRRLTPTESAILNNYKEFGEGYLVYLCDTLRDSEKLAETMSRNSDGFATSPSPDLQSEALEHLVPPVALNDSPHQDLRSFLIHQKIVTGSDGKYATDPLILDFVNRLESYLLALVPRRIKRRSKSTQEEESSSDPQQ